MGRVTSVSIPDELVRLGLPPLPEALPADVVDNHTHLDSTHEMSGLSPEANLSAAESVGVTRTVQVGCDVVSSYWAADFAAQHEQVVAAVAVHPNDAVKLVSREAPAALDEAMAQIQKLAMRPQVRAVGETGLDYFRTHADENRELQRRAFAAHIEIAKATGKTLVIHDRDAHADVLSVLDKVGWPERTVFHCFSGDADFALVCLKHEVWLSFGGSLTFKANVSLRKALAVTPPERVLLETDAPYLTPAPLRGRPNAPYLAPHTLRFLVENRALNRSIHTPGEPPDLETWCHEINLNTDEAYGGPWSQVG